MCKITKNVGYDRISISGKFPSGAHFRFFIGRSGEKLEMAFSNDDNIAEKQFKIFKKFVEFRKGENNAQRIERLESICEGCKSGAELIEKMK